jgi:ubiquinone/menaquinone biosynthesis C-methylase UbiE
MTEKNNIYWKTFLGIELFKIQYFLKYFLYRSLGIKLPKLIDQREYWARRGQVYMNEIISSGYLEHEVFFQNMLIEELKRLKFDSIFEAGCGFGWNIRRIKEEFPRIRIGGLDFSATQLKSGEQYLKGMDIRTLEGDICKMPYSDNEFDIGFSLGVFMNIHPSKISMAIGEMMRVCRKYVIHLEYDENNTTNELREKRAFKTNIVSHDYKRLYESCGKKIVKLLTFKDFGESFKDHQNRISGRLERWEDFEGSEKYMMIIIEM